MILSWWYWGIISTFLFLCNFNIYYSCFNIIKWYSCFKHNNFYIFTLVVDSVLQFLCILIVWVRLHMLLSYSLKKIVLRWVWWKFICIYFSNEFKKTNSFYKYLYICSVGIVGKYIIRSQLVQILFIFSELSEIQLCFIDFLFRWSHNTLIGIILN